MSAPATPPKLLEVGYVIMILRRREDELRTDLVLKIHTDGSGRIQDNATDADVFVFESLAELDAWLVRAPDMQPVAPNVRRRFWISNPCTAAFHRHCQTKCDCHCHAPEVGGA